jgi:truncated hemoglobin YjbI
MTFDCKENEYINYDSNANQKNSQELCQSENQTPGTLVNVAINAFKDFNRN